MKIVRTIGSNVVIRADLETRKLSNVIQALEKKLTFIGTVICIGPDVKEIKVGERVHYGNDRKPLKIDTANEDVVIVKEQDIFVVVE